MRLRDRIRGWFWLPERALVLLLSRAHDSYESVCVHVTSCIFMRWYMHSTLWHWQRPSGDHFSAVIGAMPLPGYRLHLDVPTLVLASWSFHDHVPLGPIDIDIGIGIGKVLVRVLVLVPTWT